MITEEYYIGSDLKFKIDINATGFNQETDPYDIDVYCGKKRLHFTQEHVKWCDDNFYLPVPTDKLAPGQLKIVITAHVPDDDFDDGYRDEIIVKKLRYYIRTVEDAL